MELIKKKYYNKKEIQYIKETVDIRKLMEYFGEEPDRNGFYNCPNPNHHDEHPSALYIEEKALGDYVEDNILKDGQKLKNCIVCFSCPDVRKKQVNIIDNIKLVQYKTGKRDFVSIINFLIDFANGNPESIIPEKKIIKTVEEYKEEEKKKIDVDNIYENIVNLWRSKSESIHDLHTEKKFFLDKYFQKRAIKYERIKPFLEKNNIEIRHIFIKDVNSCLIFIGDKQMLQRQIEDYLQDNEKAPHDKYVKGHNTYTYLNNNNKDLMIFEGFYDFLSYLSIMEVDDYDKNDFVILNSVKNVSRLLKEQDLEKYKMVGVFTDNDPAGIEAAEEIKESLNKPNVIFYLPKNNDWNEDIVEMEQINRETRIFKKGLK